MNLADRELCEKLFSISGWDDRVELQQDILVDSDVHIRHLPRYTLSYLIRKLPSGTFLYKNAPKGERAGTGGYTVFVRKHHVDTHTLKADTPENAAALLAIKLIEEAII